MEKDLFFKYIKKIILKNIYYKKLVKINSRSMNARDLNQDKKKCHAYITCIKNFVLFVVELTLKVSVAGSEGLEKKYLHGLRFQFKNWWPVLRSAKRAPANVRRLNNISDVIFYCSVGESSRALALLNAAQVRDSWCKSLLISIVERSLSWV